MQTSFYFAGDSRAKVRCFENVYPEERTNSVFIDGLPAKNQSSVRLFW